VCEADTDTDTTYTAGGGISLTGTTFSINTAQTQRRVTGSCAPGSYMYAINANGLVSCRADNDSGGDITSVTAGAGLDGGGDNGAVTIKRIGGFVSIGSSAMFPTSINNSGRCYMVRGVRYAYWDLTSSYDSCSAIAHINLPNGATVIDMVCRLYSNDTGTDDLFPFVRLDRYALHNGERSAMAALEVSHVDADTIRTLYTNSIANPLVDNGSYSYSISFFARHTNTVGTKNRFYSCAIGYTFE
jgi:hypothetical protein